MVKSVFWGLHLLNLEVTAVNETIAQVVSCDLAGYKLQCSKSIISEYIYIILKGNFKSFLSSLGTIAKFEEFH